jgi:hypothetical protein
MKNKNLLTQILLTGGLLLLIFISFYEKEHGDMKVVIFGTILYSPYVFALSIGNYLTIGLFEAFNKRIRILNYLAQLAPLIIWFFLADREIVIRYWKVGTKEFAFVCLVLGISNMIGYYLAQRVGEKMASHQA